MEQVPKLFRRYGTQLWHIVILPVFFLVFSAIYRPEGLVAFLDMGGRFFFNLTIMMCITLGSYAITRNIFYLLRNSIPHMWWAYILWCLLEVVIAAAFNALYVTLMLRGAEGYFDVLGECVGWMLLILLFPYVVLCFILSAIAGKEVRYQSPEEASLLRFHDVNKQLKLVLAEKALLYISAEENYVRIHYLDGEEVKDYQLRASMNGIEPVVSRAGIFRCQRSYYVNPSHIKALRKETGGSIVAELDCAGISVPVSKNTYEELSKLI
jgi:hypothetical protein